MKSCFDKIQAKGAWANGVSDDTAKEKEFPDRTWMMRRCMIWSAIAWARYEKLLSICAVCFDTRVCAAVVPSTQAPQFHVPTFSASVYSYTWCPSNIWLVAASLSFVETKTFLSCFRNYVTSFVPMFVNIPFLSYSSLKYSMSRWGVPYIFHIGTYRPTGYHFQGPLP